MIAWHLAAAGIENPFFPSPLSVMQRAEELWIAHPAGLPPFQGSGLEKHVLPSLIRTVGAWSSAVVTGVLAGVILGRSPILAWVDPALQLVRAVPPPLLVPVVIALLPLGDPVQLTIIFFGCLWPVLIAAIDGSREADPALIETARLYRLSRVRYYLSVIAPAAAGRASAGIRYSASLSLILMVVSEMVAATEGIGFQLVDAARSFDAPALWATVLMLGLIGNVFNAALLHAERSLLPWIRRDRSTSQRWSKDA
ncbi:ABC transporter permease [Streptomyces sp. NPDC099088]|uniref:ABC transporter permease n=1 Tax=Streptomyces sp. NPDC099088 TaxID=3366101 RepID=UPI0038029D04